MRIRTTGILFDSDGVLVDSHQQVDEAWHQLSAELDLDFERLRGELVGVRAADTLGQHLPPDQLDAAVARLEELEVATAPAAQPVPGAVELVSSLPTETWAIVTSASRRLGVARWRGAGIPVPKCVVTAEQVTAGKPDPEPFLVGAALLGLEPSLCLVFEDSGPGGTAAVKAGSPVVAVGQRQWEVNPLIRVSDLRTVRLVRVDDGELELEVTTNSNAP